MDGNYQELETQIIVLGVFYAATIIALVVWLAKAVGY